MQTLDRISPREVSSFMEQWKKHPLSIPILVIILNLGFFIILLQGALDERKIELAYLFCISSTLIFIIVAVILIWRKFVFYNITELIISEMDRHIRTIEDTLSGVEIGTGAAFDDLQAPPISKEISSIISRYEVLSGLMSSVGFEPKINDMAVKALGKYHYRNGNYGKALRCLDKTKDKNDSEYNFIKGLVLWKKGFSVLARECFDKSKEPRANYYKFVTYVSTFDGNLSKANLINYVKEVSDENSPLHADIYAQINLGAAHHRIATYYPETNDPRGTKSCQLAFEIAERVAKFSEHSFGYYNSACYICILGREGADIAATRKYNEADYTELALTYLDKALKNNAKLLEYAISDRDLDWLRNSARQPYYRLIGEYYEKNNAKSK